MKKKEQRKQKRQKERFFARSLEGNIRKLLRTAVAPLERKRQEKLLRSAFSPLEGSERTEKASSPSRTFCFSSTNA